MGWEHLALLVNVADVDLDRGMVMSLDQSAGGSTFSWHVEVDDLSFLVLHIDMSKGVCVVWCRKSACVEPIILFPVPRAHARLFSIRAVWSASTRAHGKACCQEQGAPSKKCRPLIERKREDLLVSIFLQSPLSLSLVVFL